MPTENTTHYVPAPLPGSVSLAVAPAGIGASVLAPVQDAPKPKKKINARNKGKRGEREVINDVLQPVVNKVYSALGKQPPELQRNMMQAHKGGHDICGLDRFSFEVKRVETDYQESWWAQCVGQATALDAVPILLYRRNGRQWAVKLRAYVETARGVNSHELDIVLTLTEFLLWFENSLAEEVAGE